MKDPAHSPNSAQTELRSCWAIASSSRPLPPQVRRARSPLPWSAHRLAPAACLRTQLWTVPMGCAWGGEASRLASDVSAVPGPPLSAAQAGRQCAGAVACDVPILTVPQATTHGLPPPWTAGSALPGLRLRLRRCLARLRRQMLSLPRDHARHRLELR